MRTGSLRFRLTAWYALILLAAFASTGAGIRFAMQRSIYETIDRELRARLAAMRDFIDRQAHDPQAGTLTEELAEEDAITPAGAQFRVAEDGRWIYQSSGARQWDARVPPAGSETLTTVSVSGRRVRVLTARAAPLIVQIGMPLDAFDAMTRRLTAMLLLASPVVLLLASAGGYWMSGRALRPVAEIAETADAIQGQDLSRRLPVRGSGDELDHLSSTLNAMFERLESAFERMRQFTADASHEMRTPVAIIRTTAELARSRPRSAAEYERALEQIERASGRASKLIEDLLAVARADAGAAATLREPLDLAAAVRTACEQTRPLADDAGLALRVDTPERCPVAGDGDAIGRMFVILLDNAVKYNRPGGAIEVIVRRHENAHGAAAVTEIRDTGSGIPAQDLPHIFDRFYRASKDRSRQTGGAGLGLSIAQHIARQHEGDISAESTQGHGSVFRVLLPLLKEEG